MTVKNEKNEHNELNPNQSNKIAVHVPMHFRDWTQSHILAGRMVL